MVMCGIICFLVNPVDLKLRFANVCSSSQIWQRLRVLFAGIKPVHTIQPAWYNKDESCILCVRKAKDIFTMLTLYIYIYIYIFNFSVGSSLLSNETPFSEPPTQYTCFFDIFNKLAWWCSNESWYFSASVFHCWLDTHYSCVFSSVLFLSWGRCPCGVGINSFVTLYGPAGLNEIRSDIWSTLQQLAFYSRICMCEWTIWVPKCMSKSRL